MMNPHLERIRAVLTDTDISTATTNSEGLVNEVLIMNDEYVFRFPRSDWAADHLRREARCLDLARAHVKLRLPEWTCHDGRAIVSYGLMILPGTQCTSAARATCYQLAQSLSEIEPTPTHARSTRIQPAPVAPPALVASYVARRAPKNSPMSRDQATYPNSTSRAGKSTVAQALRQMMTERDLHTEIIQLGQRFASPGTCSRPGRSSHLPDEASPIGYCSKD